KAGNILFRNASAEVSYRNVHGRPGGLSSFGAGDDDTPACSAVFARILDQVLEYLEHFIFIAGENELTVAKVAFDRHAILLRHRRHGSDHRIQRTLEIKARSRSKQRLRFHPR